jgi:hypothetical protein
MNWKKKCLRCEHEWIKRKEQEPKWCPSCNSPYWNKARKTKLDTSRDIEELAPITPEAWQELSDFQSQDDIVFSQGSKQPNERLYNKVGK